MEQYKEFIEFAPIIVVLLLFFWQNNIFVKPEQLEKKHREILKEVDGKLDEVDKKFDEVDKKFDETEKEFGNKYVELNAYKEFQNHVYSELEKVNRGINEIRDILINRG